MWGNDGCAALGTSLMARMKPETLDENIREPFCHERVCRCLATKHCAPPPFYPQTRTDFFPHGSPGPKRMNTRLREFHLRRSCLYPVDQEWGSNKHETMEPLRVHSHSNKVLLEGFQKEPEGRSVRKLTARLSPNKMRRAKNIGLGHTPFKGPTE